MFGSNDVTATDSGSAKKITPGGGGGVSLFRVSIGIRNVLPANNHDASCYITGRRSGASTTGLPKAKRQAFLQSRHQDTLQ